MPWGWDLSRTIDVHSVATASPHFDSWMDITRSTMMDGWGESRERHEPAPTAFSPYVTRVHAEMTGVSPEWVSPEPTVDAMARVDSRRYPSVVVEKLAPATSPAGRPLQYTLVVTNWGDEVLPSVRVREQVSAIEKVINVEPFANVVGNALVWDVADLRPGEQQRLSIEVHADEPLTLTQNTQVQVISDVGAVSEVRQPRPEPALVEPDPQFPAVAEPAPASPKMILPDFGPEPGDLGEPSPEFANDEPPPPARSYFEEDEPAERLPEEDEPVKAPARPRQPLSDALTMEMETPGAIGQGEQVHTVFVLHNRSDSDLTDVLLKVKLSKELQHRNGRTLELRLDRLKAGETYRTRLTTRALQTGTAHIDSQLSCADHRDRTASRQVRIAPEAARRADAVVRIPCVCPPPPCAYRPLF